MFHYLNNAKKQCYNIFIPLWFSDTSNVVLIQLWFSDTWAPDEHFIPTLVRVSVDSHLHVLQVVSVIMIIVGIIH